MEELLDEKAISSKCLEWNLEGRKQRMAQDIEELRHLCRQIARFPIDVKHTIEKKYSRAIISQYAYKIYVDIVTSGICVLEYSYMNTDYLIGENYDEIYEVWKNSHESIDLTINTIKQLVETNFFHGDNVEDSGSYVIRESDFHQGIDFNAMKEEHKYSIVNGDALLKLLYDALIGMKETMEALKNGSLFLNETEFDSIYMANYLLYRRDYWSREGEHFRQHIEQNYLRGKKSPIEILEERLKDEKNDFEHCQVGRIWRDFFYDKKELYFRMKNDGIDEEQWQYFFRAICRFEEYEKWIEELEHPHLSEENQKQRKLLIASNTIFNLAKLKEKGIDILRLYQFIDEHFVQKMQNVYQWFALRCFLKDLGVLNDCTNVDFCNQMNHQDWFSHATLHCSDNEMNTYNFLAEIHYSTWIGQEIPMGSRASKAAIKKIYRIYSDMDLCKEELGT